MSKEVDRIEVSYEMSVPKLYRQVVKAHVELLRNLKSLDGLWGAQRANSFSSWAHPGERKPTSDLVEVKELRVKWVSSQARLEVAGDDGEILKLRGLVLHTIDKVGPEFVCPQIVCPPPNPSKDTDFQQAGEIYISWEEIAGVREVMKTTTQPDAYEAGRSKEGFVESWKAAAYASGCYMTGQWHLRP
jgi:hypothetical protein